MSYRAGIGLGLRALGLEPCEPHIRCDGEGCAETHKVTNRHGIPTAWFMKRKAAPGWTAEAIDSGRSRDYCPQHKRGTHG